MNDKPVKTFRDGAIGASIWARHGKQGAYFEVTFSRSWKDQETGDTGYAQCFSARNLDGLVQVLGDALAWIENAERNAVGGACTAA